MNSLPSFSVSSDGEPSLGDWMMHHLVDSTEWHILPHESFYVQLPSGLTLHLLMVIIAGCFLVLGFGLFCRSKADAAPKGRLANLLECLVKFVMDDIVIKFLGEKDGRKLAPYFLNFFFFILTMNLMGLIPAFATATANVSVTAGFALITLTLMVIGGVLANGPVGFVKLFIPHGVPIPVLFILTPIEMIGILIKPFALTMRLFANMLAGHIVIFSLLGLITIIGWAGLPSLFMVLFVYVLELAVAFIQAYVFTLLSAMFVGEMLHPSH